MDVYAADFTGLVQSFMLRRINPNVLLPLPIVFVYVPVPGEVVRAGDS